ncbi:substrate-binding domain-containing protein [Nonomuraea dietziae]|uniref:substrate-binding domain-containing protein n=1 Tax=Nonomuraea dietziae TaxID=65515 RepID=UPI0031D87721
MFAAASLTGTFTELGSASRPPIRARRCGSTSAPARRCPRRSSRARPPTCFAAASPATMKTVTDASLAGAPATFVRNKLQIAVPADNPAEVDEFEDLADARVKVALCAPQVPCGAAAVKALDAAGLKVTPVTLEQDVKATLTKVELGEVDAALVYRTDVIAAAGKVKGIAFPEADQAIHDYPIATLTRGARR